MHTSEHSAHTGVTAHHDDRVQFLVVGDETSLAQLQSELSVLPLCARGRVFVEVGCDDEVFALTAPVRMTVSWFPRERGSHRTPLDRGEAVHSAVRAWTAEMLCNGAGSTKAILLGDYRVVSGVFEHLVDDIGMTAEAVAAPEEFGLRGRVR